MSRQLFESDLTVSEVDLRIRRLEERVTRLEATLRNALAAKTDEDRPDQPEHREPVD
jgi:hypothetical protein